MKAVASLYDRIVNPNLLIRRLTLTTNHVISEESARTTNSTPIQLDLFTDYEALEAQQKAEEEAGQHYTANLKSMDLNINSSNHSP